MVLDLLLADVADYAIPGSALLISMVAVALSAFMGSRTTRNSDHAQMMTSLKDRVDDLEEQLSECARERARLERMNVNLMKRVLKLENGDA